MFENVLAIVDFQQELGLFSSAVFKFKFRSCHCLETNFCYCEFTENCTQQILHSAQQGNFTFCLLSFINLFLTLVFLYNYSTDYFLSFD